MNAVYILEYSQNTSPISKIVRFFTGQKYSHTAMFINSFFCELNPLEKRKGEFDYHIRYEHNIQSFLRKEKRATAFKILHKFEDDDIEIMKIYWENRSNSNWDYGYQKLLFLIFAKPALKLMRIYYRRKGKPYSMRCGIWKDNVCSTAVDECLKVGGYDIFPEFSERVVYPGLFAKKLQKNKIL